MSSKPKTIDEYLARVSTEPRATLEKLRRTIRTILPDVQECISYSMPAFRFEGHVVAGFLATRTGYSYFPFSGTTLATLADDLGGYGMTKSALHFDAKRPLPLTLVRKLLRARIAETQAKAKTKVVKKAPGKVKVTHRLVPRLPGLIVKPKIPPASG